ncbi:MAG TPA: hypothetical protein VF281_01205 [Candidatus Saccharimonadales bacterium]
MSKPVGELTIEPEPSPRVEPINYAQLLRHDLLLEPRVVSTQFTLGKVALLHVFKEGNSHSIRADIASSVGAHYCRLDQDARGDLVYKVKDAMARAALLVGDDHTMTHSQFFGETSAIMNHQPLLFEPYEGVMLKGEWGKQRQLHFEAVNIASLEQRLVLLGGLAAFINFMNKEKQKAR